MIKMFIKMYNQIKIILLMFIAFAFVGTQVYADNQSAINEAQALFQEYKQNIYYAVYGDDGGSATSLRVLSSDPVNSEKGFAKVEIGWRGIINIGTSTIGIRWDKSGVNCYEISIQYRTNQDNVEKVKSAAVVTAAGLSILNALFGGSGE